MVQHIAYHFTSGINLESTFISGCRQSNMALERSLSRASTFRSTKSRASYVTLPAKCFTRKLCSDTVAATAFVVVVVVVADEVVVLGEAAVEGGERAMAAVELQKRRTSR